MGDTEMENENNEEFESRLIPILREGVNVVKMILFKKLRERAGELYPEKDRIYCSKLTGTVINEIFGSPNMEESFMAFSRENKTAIEDMIKRVNDEFDDLRIPLTDALRISVLCDYQEGVDNAKILDTAKSAGILLFDRDMPMPNSFIDLARKLGCAFGVLLPPIPEKQQ